MASAGNEITPVDELTKLPLPIYVRRSDYFSHDRNFHHHFHPSDSPDLQGYYDGKPLRYSRGQVAQKYLHDRYHSIFYGPPLPSDRRGKFTHTVLALSGVLPRQALDLYTPGEASIVTLSKGEHRFISDMKRMHIEVDRKALDRNKKHKQRERIGRFFADFVVEQAMEEIITPDKIERFLTTKNTKEKQEIGRQLLEAAVDSSVSELIPIHEQARKEGMLAVGAVAVRDVFESYFSPGKFYQSLISHREPIIA